MMNSASIRQAFLDFFAERNHTIVPSAPIVIKNDPTLLFTNAGMNQFKDYFLGNRAAPSPVVADTQKCLRVSGKHNDLEEVGVDTYHHTMFEMLGNWSFGDPADASKGYFKKDAIAWSWELLTGVYKIPKENLYVTIFEGDEKEGLPRDDEAFNEWMKYVPEDHILLGNKKDNFWEMGDTGPCGPCTEIHADCRSEEEKKSLSGASLVNNDHPQVIEIWNNVFIQYNRKKDGSLEPLPARHVDTGMGFERLVRVLQQKQSNYDTDVFSGTISFTSQLVNKPYTGNDDKASVAFRVIADHIRAISFTIADGQLPSNTGAGYVIRRILRRAVRYYYSFLDYQQPLLHKLVPVLAKQFEDVFPELYKQQDFVAKVLKEEEDSFLRTIDAGIKRFNQYTQQSTSVEAESTAFATERTGKIIAGKFAFELNDTFGFPIDLTQLMAAEIGWTVDMPGFNNELDKQKQRSRAATAVETEDWVTVQDGRQPEFKGYETLQTDTRLLRYRKVAGKGKNQYQLILEQTPFYAESGGQTGDTGELVVGNEHIRITDTKKENNLIIHFADVIPADPAAPLQARVDHKRRAAIAVHHSATHLMHAALRQVLGNHVAQKGSLVNDEYLRFDFSHFSKMTPEEITAVEDIVNVKIRENNPVVIRSMAKDEAVALGAMALFGEKYGDTVRVVEMDPKFSIELCGGTHTARTGDLGYFKIKQETAIAAGVRRIEALSGKAAEQYVNENLHHLFSIESIIKNNREPAKAVEQLISENNKLQKRIESLEARQLVAVRNELLQKDEIIGQVTFIGDIIEVGHADALKKLCFDLKNHLHDYIVVLA
ncbi:MAG: alanine--tRNA ligase, partial [Ferruginibacter sp.]